MLATRLGIAAVDAAHDEQWGSTVVLKGTEIETVSLSTATQQQKSVPEYRYHEAAALFG